MSRYYAWYAISWRGTPQGDNWTSRHLFSTENAARRFAKKMTTTHTRAVKVRRMARRGMWS